MRYDSPVCEFMHVIGWVQEFCVHSPLTLVFVKLNRLSH